MPRSIIQMPSFQPLFKFAIAALSVKQFEALDSVIYFWIRLVSPSVRHLENVKTRRERGDSTLSGQRHFPSPHSPGFHQCHSSGDDQDDYDYPIDQVVGAVSVCGFELTQALMEGLLYTFPPDFMSDASRILVSVAEIICLGLEFAPNAVIPPPSPASQSFSTIQPQQQPVFMEWMQSLILQIPDVNMNSRDRQLFLSDFSSALRAQDWNRSKRLLNDFRSIYRRKNSRAEKLN
ncbi:hypothetical protein EV182_008082 [Spiromyces aspiralis]|uniref:Uncharacterized protein n=1 Tax=Spiromyces aspiralis TaxID=68401 RepID=A0ACC1HM85_9FUNG|nr:hypothetical protein EV182_008082 [Spiromyces aspiralis]